MLKMRGCGAAALSVALAASLCSLAHAADQPAPADRTAQHDFTKLSTAGQRAFDDVALARLAIFDGHPAKAATLIASARSAFDRAAVDRTAFVKAENALQPPASMRPAQPAPSGATPTTWVPVAQGFVVNETLAPPKQTATAVDHANQSLKGGTGPAAVEALKVAKVSAVDTVALAPLQASQSDLRRADQLASAADYYGASQALRALEDGIRYDTVDVSGTPAATGQQQAANQPAGDHVGR